MQIKESHIVPILDNPIRFQEYAVGIFSSIPTKSAIKKAIKKELIFIDEQLATTAKFIKGSEKIILFTSEEKPLFKRFKLPLEVVFEDDYLAIINKPAGVLVSGNTFKTIDNALQQNLQKSRQFDAVRPRPVHRLDYPTTGLLAIGKTNASILALNSLFEQKKITKTYFAITIGKMKTTDIINLPIDDKIASSRYEVLQSVSSKRFALLNLVKLHPTTGRRHQLRKHLAGIGNPILGDQQYGISHLILKGKGMYLHAGVLEFTHPFTKKPMKIQKELPEAFTKIISYSLSR
jgi:23S rRNA pseudouridine1911/1915/1917 synthase